MNFKRKNWKLCALSRKKNTKNFSSTLLFFVCKKKLQGWIRWRFYSKKICFFDSSCALREIFLNQILLVIILLFILDALINIINSFNEWSLKLMKLHWKSRDKLFWSVFNFITTREDIFAWWSDFYHSPTHEASCTRSFSRRTASKRSRSSSLKFFNLVIKIKAKRRQWARLRSKFSHSERG